MSVIFPKPLDTCYEELRRMYPVFMLKFKEIDALLKTEESSWTRLTQL